MTKKKLSQLKLPAIPKKTINDLTRYDGIDPQIVQTKITENQYCSSKYVFRKVSLTKN